MSLVINADGYAYFSGKEGAAPVLLAKVSDYAQALLLKTDISTVKATIKNITSGATVLDQVTLVKNDVWFDTIQTLTITQNGVSVTYSYNFKWPTLSSYFTATTSDDDSQYKIEVWVTPVSGQQVDGGWWFYTAHKSIVPIPA